MVSPSFSNACAPTMRWHVYLDLRLQMLQVGLNLGWKCSEQFAICVSVGFDLSIYWDTCASNCKCLNMF